MLILLPCNVECSVGFDLTEGRAVISMVFQRSGEQLGEYTLKHDAYPDLRYLLILYFYDELITGFSRRPHAITLQQYAEIYEAMFGVKCVYTDKNSSIDQLRSHELPKRILKRCGLSFARGGLCQFKQGTPDRAKREAFRAELLDCFRKEWGKPDLSAKAKRMLQMRYETLRGYLWQSPARYLSIPRLVEQEMCVSDRPYLLYSYRHPLDWVSLIEANRHILLHGLCGCGKSTLLQCIMLDPSVMDRYTVIFRHLVTQSSLYTKAEAEHIEKYTHVPHLFLLDGFNEIGSNDLSGVRFLSALERLAAYPNVRIIVSSTFAPAFLQGFVSAELGSVMPEGEQDIPKPVYGTPLIYNSYQSAPNGVRDKLKSEYLVLDYATKVKLSHLLEKADNEQSHILHITYRALLPMLAEMLCANDKLCFHDADVQYLLEKISGKTEESVMLRLYNLNAGLFTENDSSMIQCSFAAAVEQGEILIRAKQYMFRHQRIRDYYAVKYELDKLDALLSDLPDRFIVPRLNLGSSATELLRQQVGFAGVSPQIPSTGIIDKLSKKIRQTEIDEDSFSSLVKLCYAYAQLYEYVFPYKLKYDSYELNIQSAKVLHRLADWVCAFTDTVKELLAASDETQLKDMLAFVLCKQAELTMNFIHEPLADAPSPEKRISTCLNIVEGGTKVHGFHLRLMHNKAKALLYKAELYFRSCRNSAALRFLNESIDLLGDCFEKGSFLSGNLLAFMFRSPVPSLLELKPDILEYETSFRINVLIAMNPALHGIMPSYARNEAIDALLMGEVSLNAYTRLNEIYRLFKTDEGTKEAVSTGKGRCGKKELKLARALLTSRGGTLGDTRPFTAFFEFMADWYESLFSGTLAEARDALCAAHRARLKEREQIGAIDRCADLLVLGCLAQSEEEVIACSNALAQEIALFENRLRALAQSPKDPSGADLDHPYYLCRRFLYYLTVFEQNGFVCKWQASAQEAFERLRQCMKAFEEAHPAIKLTKSSR